MKIFLFLLVFISITSVAQDFYHTTDPNLVLNAFEKEMMDWINRLREKQEKATLLTDVEYIKAFRNYSKILENKSVDKNQLRIKVWEIGRSDYHLSPAAINAEGSIKQILIKLKKDMIEFIGQDLISDKYNKLALGVFIENDRLKAVIGLISTDAFLERFPKAVKSEEVYNLTGKLSKNYNSPVLFVTDPFGVVQKLITKESDGQFSFNIKFPSNKKGRYELELLLKGPNGPTVANLFPVFLNVTPDFSSVPGNLKITHEKDDLDEDDSADKLFEMTNETRKKSGLQELKKNKKLSKIAFRHSKDMAKKNYFAHQSPDNKNVADRAQEEEINFQIITENLGKNKSIFKAFDDMMASPGHRGNILNEKVKELGVGVYINDEDIKYITMNFATLKTNVIESESDFAEDLLEKINQIRKEAGFDPLEVDDQLMEIAKKHTDRMKEEKNVIKSVNLEGRALKNMRYLVLKTGSFDGLLKTSIVRDEKIKHIAIAAEPADNGTFYISVFYSN